ncbi:MAG: ChbG/HpnK family deacetylase [Alphaproteobacteria bacterium]|nr:ChbG/HpnK family deacetylase [Alphaproteobacteria bacterium]
MMTATEKLVVIHADDLGMSHSANLAFAELTRLGVCGSGSVMVPCPWFPEIAAMARQDVSLDIGVHLTLTSEMRHFRWRPLTRPSSSSGLVDDDGYFHRQPSKARRRAAPAAVEAELRAQIEAALAAGIDVTHLDDHAGTVLAPEFCAIYIRLGLEYGLPILITPDLASYGGLHNMEGVAPAAYGAQATAAEEAGFAIFDRIIETPWTAATATMDEYGRLFSGITPGRTFMALHFAAPGDIEAIDPVMGHRRIGEYLLFRLPEFGQWLQSTGLRLEGMRGLRAELRRRLAARRSA